MKKLYRSREDRIFAGVCGGIAEYFGIDSTIVRVLAFLLIVPGGLSICAYIILAIIIPKEPSGKDSIKDDYGEEFYSPKGDYRKEYERQKRKSDDDFY